MSGRQYQYRIYGLTLRTTRPLPELEPVSSASRADVVVELAGMDALASMPAEVAVAPAAASAVSVVQTPAGPYFRVRYAAAGEELLFVLDPAGTRVWVTWTEAVGLADVAAMLLGPILVCILRRRAHTCLHASVIGIAGRAYGFLGAKGAGKTTTALALVREGADLVSDDVAVLDSHGGGFDVRVGLPRMRMRPGPVAALGTAGGVLRPLWSSEEYRPDKRYLDLADRRSESMATSLPLQGLFVLAPRGTDAPRVVPLDGGHALPLLMANRHMTIVVERDGHARDFVTLGRLVTRVPVHRVERPEGLSCIDDLTRVILEHVGAPS